MSPQEWYDILNHLYAMNVGEDDVKVKLDDIKLETGNVRVKVEAKAEEIAIRSTQKQISTQFRVKTEDNMSLRLT